MRLTSRLSKGVGAALFTCLLAGCGGYAVDLDSTVQTQGLPEGVLVRQRNPIMAFGVGTRRLFWATRREVRGCLKSDCASSLVTYSSIEEEYPAITYRLNPEGDVLGWLSERGLFSCTSDGCGTLRQVGQNEQGSYASDEAGVVVVGNDAIHGLSFTAGGWTRLRRLPPNESRFMAAIHDGYLYWCEGNVDGGEGARLMRTLRDGAGEVEVVTRSVSLSAGFGNLAFDSAFVYFADSRQYGAVVRCPLSGCVDVPEIVVNAVREPNLVLADDAGVCFTLALNNSDWAAACARNLPSAAEQRSTYVSLLSMDADDLYVVRTQTSVFDPSFYESAPTLDIVRMAR